jgi:hypothetical protein
MKKGGMGDPSPKQKNMDPMAGKGGGTGMEPMGGGDEPRERRPRQGEKEDRKQAGGGGGQKQQQMPKGGKPTKPMTGGVRPDPIGGKMLPPTSPLLPIDDDVVRDVWGHLPEKLRQQATEYYKQEIMPRYAELLKRYYSSLAEKK